MTIRQTVVENAWKRILSFTYTNSKGERSTKVVEPYDVKDSTAFYGFDLAEGKTKLFKYSNIEDLSVEGEFEPRF